MKYFCFYPQICDALYLGQKSFSSQWIGFNAETHSCSKIKGQWVLSHRWGIYTNPHQTLKEYQVREDRKTVRARRWGGWLWSAVLWTQYGCCTHEPIAVVITVTRLSELKFSAWNGVRVPRPQSQLWRDLLLVATRGIVVTFGEGWVRFPMSQWITCVLCMCTSSALIGLSGLFKERRVCWRNGPEVENTSWWTCECVRKEKSPDSTRSQRATGNGETLRTGVVFS